MTGETAVYTLKTLLPEASLEQLTRWTQTAKQIGSAWPTGQINLIWLGYQYRIVIE